MGHGTRSQERRCGFKKHSPEAAEQHHDRLQEHPGGPLSAPVVGIAAVQNLLKSNATLTPPLVIIKRTLVEMNTCIVGKVSASTDAEDGRRKRNNKSMKSKLKA